jgi:hypothetical protein
MGNIHAGSLVVQDCTKLWEMAWLSAGGELLMRLRQHLLRKDHYEHTKLYESATPALTLLIS